MFYDIRAAKYLESSINSSRAVVLKTSRGYVVSILILIYLTFFIVMFYSIFVISTLMKISCWIKVFNKWNIHQLFIHIAMIIQEQDYFLQEDHYLLIYVAIMQAYGNNNINMYCFDIIDSILILHKIFISTIDKILQYFVSDIPWASKHAIC